MKSVLITGCSSGLGLYMAESLQQDGWKVFATARKEEDIENLRSKGIDAFFLDVTNSESIEKLVKYVSEKTDGKLYALINNAGCGYSGALEDITRDAMRNQFEVNVFGVHELTNQIIPTFRKNKRGRIINISSAAGRFSTPFMGAYSASKFALEALSDALRLELRNTGIKISIIEPGPLKSDFSKNALAIFQNQVNPPKNSHYKDIYEKMGKYRQTKETKKNIPGPDVFYKKVKHALESKRPKIRYPVTMTAYLASYLKRIFPDRLLDILLKLYLNRKYGKL
ncbi:SDR family NAD(P)-dependent oxidoreductase [bacterium]|nr:SDR family NAD(P)-dependent oxidoreductase [bacterium]